jgi:hypothetical protein
MGGRLFPLSINNLQDISTAPDFAAFLGLTQEELEGNFAPYIKKTAEKLRMSEKELLTRIRDYYDGFSFDWETKVCNPSPLCFSSVKANLKNTGRGPAPTSSFGNFSRTRNSQRNNLPESLQTEISLILQ